MKLGLKLPLAFAAGLLLELGAAAYGIRSLNASIDTYAIQVHSQDAEVKATAELAVAFKTQVQEWKDVLLRGRDPAALAKHWNAFTTIEAATDDKARRLAAALPEGQLRQQVQRFAEAHAAMGQGYRKALDAFKSAGFDPVAGDTAVRGMDREPARLLAEVAERLARQSAATSAQADAQAHRAMLVSIALMLAVSALGFCGALAFSRAIARSIGTAADVARAVAVGDLGGRIQARGDDEVGQLLAALKDMQESLGRVVGQVRRNAEGVAAASSQISQGNADLSSRTENQAGALEQTAASMEQLGSTVAQNADNARQARRWAQDASEIAVKGGTVVQQVVDTMNGISDSSRRIADIIGVIDGIAFQTNILALNAAVEAARAGEQGRGFAVVAGEVRGLAQRSASAAKEIKSLIGISVERVEQGALLADRAGHTMSGIVAAIRRVTEMMGEISAASDEQSNGVAQVGEAVTQMDRATQQNAALVEEAAAAAQSLNHQAEQLVQAVSTFRLAAD